MATQAKDRNVQIVLTAFDRLFNKRDYAAACPKFKASFELTALYANLKALIDEVERAKPATAKGKYFRKITVSSTMGPGVKVDPTLINETV